MFTNDSLLNIILVYRFANPRQLAKSIPLYSRSICDTLAAGNNVGMVLLELFLNRPYRDKIFDVKIMASNKFKRTSAFFPSNGIMK